MTLTTIEKAAKLMGIGINCQNPDDEKYYLATTGFNPYTSKSDLSDVIDELGIDIYWYTDKRQCVLAQNIDQSGRVLLRGEKFQTTPTNSPPAPMLSWL